jgi:hypothetical protein
MHLLLALPTALSFLIVALAAVALALSGLTVVRRRFSPESLRQNHEVAAVIFSAFGWFYNRDRGVRCFRYLDGVRSGETEPGAGSKQRARCFLHHPFTGRSRVSDAPLERALAIMGGQVSR